MTTERYVYVLTNPPGVGVGLPLGTYSSLGGAELAAYDLGQDCRVQAVPLDAPADYAASQTVRVINAPITEKP